MTPSENQPAPVLSPPTPVAAVVWQDESELFERLRRRLTSYSANTQRAYASDWRVWRSWCTENGRAPFPAQPPDLVDYLLAHSPPLASDSTGNVVMDVESESQAIRRATTVRRWLASISALHRIAEVDDPIRSEDVKAAKRTISRGRALPDQKAPLRWSDVLKALSSLGISNRDLRAKAMIAVAYSTMARRAELVGICVEDLTYSSDGDGTVTLRTKGGYTEERYLANEARAALATWLEQASIESGPVFRRIERHGGVGDRTVTPAEVARTFKRIANLIGLDSGQVTRVSGHSTRIGAAQDLTASGAALPEIMLAGGWKSPDMPIRYSRRLTVHSGAMKKWLSGK